VERKSSWSLGQDVRILNAEHELGQWLISAVATLLTSVPTADRDHHADTAGMSAIYEICQRKALL
jgi:hypothetical protein